MTLAIVVPLVWLVLMVRVEAIAAYAKVQAFLASKPSLPPALRDLPWVGAWAQDMLQQLSADPTAIREQLVLTLEQSSVEVSKLIGGVGRNAAKLFFAVLSMFFLLRDGPRLVREARAILEGILGPRVHDYLDAIGATTQAVVYALILGAIAQGAVAGIGYWIFGVEAPVLMGAVTVLIALIPFGAPLVWGSLGDVDARDRQPVARHRPAAVGRAAGQLDGQHRAAARHLQRDAHAVPARGVRRARRRARVRPRRTVHRPGAARRVARNLARVAGRASGRRRKRASVDERSCERPLSGR